MTIPLHDAAEAMHDSGWYMLHSVDQNTHWVRGSSRCILVTNGVVALTPIARLHVIATQYAPVDVMDGRLAALDRIHLAETAQRAKGKA